MKTLSRISAFLLLAAAAACVRIPEAGGEDVCEGAAAAFSPDGKTLAFQRERGDFIDVWTRDLASGEETLVERMERGRAGQPTWTRDGGLVYILSPATNTSYAAAKAKCDVGCNLYLSKDGKKRRLTFGRWRDSTPHAAVDGKVYYVTKGRGEGKMKNRGTPTVYALDPADPAAKPVPVYAPPSIHSAGVSQPVVSPDGRLLAWAELDGWDDVWHICVAKLSDPSDFLVLTPPRMVAYEPNWTPDSAHLVFTGYREGDGGWSVYAADIATGALKRLFRGTEPAVSPDGRRIAYTEDGRIRLKPFAVTFDADAVPAADPSAEPEKVIWSAENPKNGARVPMTDDFRFGSERTVFVRAKFRFDGDCSKYQDIVQCAYGESPLGLDLYMAKGIPHFGLRDGAGDHIRVAAPSAVKGACEMRMTGVRTRDGFYLSVNDGPVLFHNFTRGSLPLDTPKSVLMGSTFNPASAIGLVEVGTGWPANVPRLRTGKELMK